MSCSPLFSCIGSENRRKIAGRL